MKAQKLETVFDEAEGDRSFRMPEHDLMASILASAISDAAGQGQWVAGNSLRERRRRQAEARRWIFSDAVYCAPGLGISFQFICEVLDVDATSIRKTTENNPGAISELMTVFRDRSMKGRNLKTLK